MEFYEFVLQNKEIFKIFYALIIISICWFIFWKSHKIFSLSYHQGVRYFRNAFLFYAAGFFSRYFLKFAIGGFLANLFFEFFFAMAGFFLLYSLLWKKFESVKIKSYSSLFNIPIVIFYLLSLIIIYADLVASGLYFLFISQIILFALMSMLTLLNYVNRKQSFLKFYFTAVVLIFIAWLLNFIALSFFELVTPIIIGVYILNLIFFFILLYGVAKLT